MWNSLFANIGSNLGKRLIQKDRLCLITRTVFSQVSFRFPRWPPQEFIAKELNSVQRKMIAACMKLVPETGEPIETFCRRRAREAGKLAKHFGLWSEAWLAKVKAYDAHILRSPNSPMCILRRFHDQSWLQNRRAAFVTQSIRGGRLTISAGRTDTRVTTQVQPRWEEGCSKSCLPAERLQYRI
jgi:hypothetical protein